MEPTRRTMLIGGAGLAVLGCAGGGREDGPAPEEPRREGKAKQQRSTAEVSALFRVDPTVERPSVRWDASPAWFRTAPGLWCPNTRTAGSVLLTFSPRGRSPDDLCDRIKSYRELPSLLEGARAYGTEVLYLTDWYEGLPGASCDEYWRHKASYQPRADLGGEAALIDGLRAVKAAGGHVLLYVEPFVLDKESDLGKKKGADWALMRADGHPDEPYPGAWKLCPNAPGLVAHFEEVADRVVGGYGASGLFLDSYGNQRGWKCVERSHRHPPGEGQVFDEGARKLVRAMTEAARKRDPQAVVMLEGSKMPAMFTSASGAQDWGIHELVKRWSWREAGNVAIFSAGWSLDDVHQVLALGHRIAVGGDWWSVAPTGTCATQVADARARVGEPKDDRMRRYAGEELFRALHRFRNGALLAGRAVPSLEALTPRRWDQNEVFESREAFVALLDRCGAAAERIDEALGGGADLPAPQEHLRKLLRARARFAEVLQGAEITVLPAPSPESAAYRFDGPRGTGLTCVNVGADAVRAGLSVDGGVFEDLLAGGKERAQGALRVEVPGHALGMWASPRA